MRRRTLLKTVGVGTTAGVLGASSSSALVAASSSYESVSVPTSKTLNSVVRSSEGIITVGDGGHVLLRTAAGWQLRESNGLNGGGNNLTDTAATGNGNLIWMCGSSGAVGAYDVNEDRFYNHSQPNGIGNNWTSIHVNGMARKEEVILVNSSGQLLRGYRDGCRSMSWETVQKPSGNSIFDLAESGYKEYQIVGGSGTVYESTDDLSTWDQIGISNFGKTLLASDNTALGEITTVGKYGWIADYDSNGWTTQSFNGSHINDVRRAGSSGTAVGKGGMIYNRENGSWVAQSTAYSQNFNSICKGPANGSFSVIVGSNGTVLEKGTFNPPRNQLTLTNVGTTDASYSIEVEGSATSGTFAESTDTVSTSGGISTLSGNLETTAGNYRDNFGFSGELSSASLTDINARDVNISLNGSRVTAAAIGPTEWSEVNSPTSAGLYAVSQSSNGPFAAGSGGKLLQRDSSGWSIVVKNGPSSNGNTMRICQSTENDNTIWFGGSSGSLGTYTVSNGNLTDRTAPQNISNTWSSIAILGDSGSERVLLGSGSGQILIGNMSSSGMQWNDPITLGSGSTVKGITFPTGSIGYACDGNGDVFKTTDAGNSWQKIGIPSAGGTPQDIVATAPSQVTVSCGSGYIARYDGYSWTSRKFGGSSRKAVDEIDDRRLIVGGGGIVQSDEYGGWKTTLSGGKTINDVTMYSGQNELAVAVGNSGRILQKQLTEDLY